MTDKQASEKSGSTPPAGTPRVGLIRRLTGVLLSVGALLFVVGMLLWGGLGVALDATNETEFCVSCHSMNHTVYQEYKESPHYQNRSGVRAGCSDCHVPKEFGAKMVAKVMAYKDVLGEILGTVDTPEKFEKLRWEMANRVWDKMRARDSKECRNCHQTESMDIEAQGRMASSKHEDLLTGESDKTCIDCHKGLVHEEPWPPEEEV